MHLEKRILVTGGACFSLHLCERLIAEGANVICVDNFSAVVTKTSSTCENNKAFELIRHDVTFPLYVEIDQIYSLACPASPIHYQRDPVQTTKTSVLEFRWSQWNPVKRSVN